MFDHHQKLLLDECHTSKTPPGAAVVKMLTFDEQLKIINIESKKKSASANGSLTKNEVWKNSFWKRIKSRYEKANKKKENTNVVDRIVVLKPIIDPVVRCPVDIGCRCLRLHPHQIFSSKQHIVKHTHVSFDDVRKKLKYSNKLNNLRKMKSWAETGSLTENISLVSYSKHQEPDFFTEARRHLAERLRLMGMGVGEPLGSSCKQQVSGTLERMLVSSPIHESMADFGPEPGSDHSSPFMQTEYLTASGSNSFLSRGSKLSDMGLVRNNAGPSPSGTHGVIEGSEMELLLNVSSPKAGCKPENMDNNQLRENPSPVSVLDSLFSDSSPTSPVELRIQPRRLSFEELLSQTLSPQREPTSLRSSAEDRGFISSYVNEIYQTAQSNWDGFLATDYPLESPREHKVLHDCVKEVLVSLHSRKTLFTSRVQPFSLEKDVINRVIDQVDWHNGQPMGPRTLDHLIRRDIAKHDPWLDTLSDRNDILVEVADETLHELVIEAILDIFMYEL